MRVSDKSWLEYYEQALQSIEIGSDYHKRSQNRYIHTATLTDKQVSLTKASSVAEIGPGLLLPMMRLKWRCECTAYGLLGGAWQRDLSTFGISTVRWDANNPLPDSQIHEKHNLIFFCEVIEHLNRWPIKVLKDIYSLLKPGGTLILTTVNFVRISNRIRMLSGRSALINPFEKTPDGSNHIREYTVDELEYYLAKAGFVNIHSYLWSFYSGGVTAAIAKFCGTLIPSTRNYVAMVASKPTLENSD